jgi:transcription antitermination factor NusG
MSDINDLSEEEKEQTQKWFDEAYIERDKYSELEAENARLKGKVAQLEEAFDVKNRVHEKLNKDYLQLKAELAARDWQSADKLPEEEGFYVISVNNIILEDSEPTEVKDLQDTLTSLEYCKKMGYRNIKHFKLPPVEGK